ncbi:MAG: alpha/beta fold hydrolase [Bacteroidota bacterium]
MPIVPSKPFKAPFYQLNGNLQTIIPSIFRSVNEVTYSRERIDTPDGDFLDLDWSVKGSNKIVLISHGLEGSTDRHYVKGAVKLFNNAGWDACAWNCRSCSGEMNRLPRFYHHADTPDLQLVVEHIILKNKYQVLILLGFSMGGSLTLKYLGENGDNLPKVIKKGIAVSVPCSLSDCSIELEKPGKMYYNKRFFKKLSQKVRTKAVLMPDKISVTALDKYKIKSLRKFDDHYSAPLHGFKDANDFYDKASSMHYLKGIRRPALIINALNDPFLVDRCYPYEIAKKHEYLQLETPNIGGHVGFMISSHEATYAELTALEFAEK